jgi:hypothetical protein
VRSSGTRDKLLVVVAGGLCVLLLAACSKSASSSGSASSAAGTGTPTAACSLLTKAEVAQAANAAIAFTRQASLGSGSSCTYGSLSGFAVILSVQNSPAAGLTSNIPGLGNVVSRYQLTPVPGIGDQAYAGADAIIAQKGNTAFVIVYGAVSGGSHEQALKTMATDVASRL